MAHTYALAVPLLAFGQVAGHPLVVHLALSWIAHIGFDRLLGYGLKYSTGFRDPHFQRV